MPSRVEPCGLNQMYSLRYGTIPVVRAVGGLADTVVDASNETLADGSANGFTFAAAEGAALAEAALRAMAAMDDPELWARLQLAGMGQDFSWRHSAREYERLYAEAIGSAGAHAG